MIYVNLMEKCSPVAVFQSDLKHLNYNANMVKNIKNHVTGSKADTCQQYGLYVA